MINAFTRIRRFLNKLVGFIPGPLPVGMSEFDKFVDSLMSTYALPTTNRDSICFTVATAIMHLGPTVAYKPKMYFVLMIKAGAAKQVGNAAFFRIKEKQMAEQAAAKQVEAATQLSVVAPNEQSIQN